jgi:thymidine kinase
MFSGKSEELIRRLRRAAIARQKVQAFKPAIDNRYGKDTIVSHDARTIESIPITRAEEILDHVHDDTRVVGIDEAQFLFGPVVDVCERLANRGIRVIVAGLDQDYLGRPFEPIPQLLAVADSITKVTAVCVVCGRPATKSQRLIASRERVVIGDGAIYEPRCRACFRPLDATASAGESGGSGEGRLPAAGGSEEDRSPAGDAAGEDRSPAGGGSGTDPSNASRARG